MMYVKMDVFKITEMREGCVYKTKRVAFHWFQLGKSPDPNVRLAPELVAQNGLPPGDYFYCSTTDYVTDVRIPQGGLYA